MEIVKPKRKLGRIIIELYSAIVPKTCHNFLGLCSNTNELSYKKTPFHRIISGYLCQGGDVTERNGTGGKSIYGGNFEDENFKLKHNEPGILSMYNTGKNTNNSIFNLTFKKLQILDGKNVVFGRIINGLANIYKASNHFNAIKNFKFKYYYCRLRHWVRGLEDHKKKL